MRYERYRNEDCAGFIEQWTDPKDGERGNQKHNTYESAVDAANRFAFAYTTVAIFKIKLKSI